MIDDLKRVLYVSKGNRLPSAADFTEPGVKQRVQDFVEALGLPPAGHRDEYAAVMEAVYSRPEDRRRYLQDRLEAAQPGYANLCFAALIAARRVDMVWTTNFDQVVERACERFGAATSLMTATPESGDAAVRAVTEGRVPLYVKLHGDYRYERLKNTGDELQAQDQRLRQALITAGQRYGLIVAGFSGRDASVLDALHGVLTGSTPFPHGLFWVHRSADPPPPQVDALLAEVRAGGVDAHKVKAETFGELITRLVEMSTVPASVSKVLTPHRPVRHEMPFVLPGTSSDGDAVRLNALEVIGYPKVVRRVECTIGGHSEVLAAVEAADAPVVACRTRQGVLAFGLDADVRRTFDPFGISGWSQSLLDPDRIARTSSMEQGLLYAALTGAILRAAPLEPAPRARRDNRRLIVAAAKAETALLGPLKSAVAVAATAEERKFNRQLVGGTAVCGTVPGTSLRWAESVELRLDHRFNRLWVVLRPSVWVEDESGRPSGRRAGSVRPDDRDADTPRARFLKGRLDHRYNDVADALITAWTKMIAPETGAELALFGFGDQAGIDASFRLRTRTAYARTEPTQEARRAG
ncbi:MAG TPA: SIR2 family protein [Egibacteraceae bacterium]|nr:SIR2 family protein [Egibacteraceae bacterium]